MNETVSPSKPFGLRTFYKPKSHGIPCQFIQKIGLKYADPQDVTDSGNILDKWKFWHHVLLLQDKQILLNQ